MNATAAFRRRAAAALADSRLQASLLRATELSTAKRAALTAEIPGYETERRRAAAIRRESIHRRAELLQQARAHLEAAGARVHVATDAEEARRIVHSIAQVRGAVRVVKGKSMVSEEIALGPWLAQRGLEVLETDLGEFIVQLRGEAPSHITAPALHLDRRQIARLFADELEQPKPAPGGDLDDDPEHLTAIARRHLREKFLAADLGITGANFVVAETGTVVLVENEGNIGLCSTLPPVHVVLTGIEKLVPRLADLDTLLRVLPANATGQRATAYVSLINGPSSEDRELHVIFLDNGRSTLAKREDAELLACIRCGSCLSICPVYRRAGGHAYGSVYSGPMGILFSPFLVDAVQGHLPANSLADACSLCGACGEICPVEIPLPELILAARQERAPMLSRAARGRASLFGRLTRHPRLFHRLGRWARWLPRPLLAHLVPAWSRQRELPPIALRSFRQLLRDRNMTTARGGDHDA